MAVILGIDLGTTNSSTAVFDGREIVLIPNARGSRTTPSVIGLSPDGEVLVGESARNQALVNPGRTIRSSKRHMGTGARLPFGQTTLRPEAAAAHILSRLKSDAEEYLGEEIREAVITVPAYFSETQRRATREAGRLAGLEVKRLLNEPTAAAIAWAWARNRSFEADEVERRVLVYDLGGGTFDTTVLAMRGQECRVLSTSGDNHLGGDDFDAILLEKAISSLESGFSVDSLRSDPVLLQQISDQVEQTKIELSTRESSSLVLPFAPGSTTAHPSWKITRGAFEEVIAPLIDRTVLLVEQAIAEAGLSKSDIDHLVLSGGGSRIPYVRERLKALLCLPVEGRVNPEELVSFGAAVFSTLSPSTSSFKVQDALSRSFGVEIDGDGCTTVIPKNTAVPVVKKRIFTTVCDNQSSVEIHVLQGEHRRASENLSLGRFLLSGIRAAPMGEPRIELEFSIDPDEILHVRAKDIDTGASQALTIAASAEGAIPVTSERLRSLMSRAEVLSSLCTLDRNLELELAEVRKEAESLASRADGGETIPERGEAIVLSLETLVAELEARQLAGGQGGTVRTV